MTGDAMEQIAEGTFVWIDRVKNILKLSQVTASRCNFFSASLALQTDGCLPVLGQITLSTPHDL